MRVDFWPVFFCVYIVAGLLLLLAFDQFDRAVNPRDLVKYPMVLPESPAVVLAILATWPIAFALCVSGAIVGLVQLVRERRAGKA